MISNRPSELKPDRRELVHAAMDAYLAWRDECQAVRDAYARWSAADEADARFSFETYAAALDREAQASEAYAALVQDAGEFFVPASGLAAGLTIYSQEAHR